MLKLKLDRNRHCSCGREFTASITINKFAFWYWCKKCDERK